ncbi:hypothetical protein [Paenibacillus sp. y28]|uniref:hypothetical protein n=1 Tax=Paenibacillus sp. y28 TaxID=3129110 RepID=UPI003016EDA3
MSIESQVKLGLKQYAETLQYPDKLDAAIGALITEGSQSSQRRIVLLARRPLLRIAIVAVSLFVFTGAAYASGWLYSLYSGSVSMQTAASAQLDLPEDIRAAVRSSWDEVRSGLQPGESAWVYNRQLADRKLPGVILITNPEAYPSLADWKQHVKSKYTAIKVPAMLPEGFVFTRGEMQSPISGTLDVEAGEQARKALEKKAIAGGQGMAWQHAAVAVPEQPGLLYSNDRGAQIELRYHLLPVEDKELHVELQRGGSAAAEKVSVWGHAAYFVSESSSLLSETGQMKDLSWLEQESGRTIIYTLSSASPDVSKADLLLIAEHME